MTDPDIDIVARRLAGCGIVQVGRNVEQPRDHAQLIARLDNDQRRRPKHVPWVAIAADHHGSGKRARGGPLGQPQDDRPALGKLLGGRQRGGAT